METSTHRCLVAGIVASHFFFAGAATAAGAVAEAKLAATKGHTVAGTVTFSEQKGKVVVVANVTGLTPGPHGFHVHEKGDCSAPDGTSAGGHFNPGNHAHGHHGKGHQHAGDMPTLVADASGKASATFEMKGITLAGGKRSVVGKSVIVHADDDDNTTQPTGNAGARVACGVIVQRK